MARPLERDLTTTPFERELTTTRSVVVNSRISRTRYGGTAGNSHRV
jgi:hypothetical protein